MAEWTNTFMLKVSQINDLKADFSLEEIAELICSISSFVETGEEPPFSDRALKMEFKRWKEFWDYSVQKKEDARRKKAEQRARQQQMSSNVPNCPPMSQMSHNVTNVTPKGIDKGNANASANASASASGNGSANGSGSASASVSNKNIYDIDSNIKNVYVYDVDPNESNAPKTTTPRFKKPTLDEVKEYVKQMNYIMSAEQFFNYYEANGWKVGKNPMKNWKAAVRNWESNEKKSPYNKSNSNRKRISDINEREYTKGEIDLDLNDPTAMF